MHRSPMTSDTIEAARTLIDFARDHAEDVYDPDEYPQYAPLYHDIHRAADTMQQYLDYASRV
ncbi:MAG: hypothetical protein RLZZ342_420 [Candidatus Parcubacteria bacterium]